MRRTKQWWASLTKEERSELHHLAYANSLWLNRNLDTKTECAYCGKSRKYDLGQLCQKCSNRRKQLIKKANKAIEDLNSQS